MIFRGEAFFVTVITVTISKRRYAWAKSRPLSQLLTPQEQKGTGRQHITLYHTMSRKPEQRVSH